MFFGNTGLTVDEEKGLILRDYADLPIPPASQLSPLTHSAERILENALRTYEEIAQEVVFVTPLAMSVSSKEGADSTFLLDSRVEPGTPRDLPLPPVNTSSSDLVLFVLVNPRLFLIL